MVVPSEVVVIDLTFLLESSAKSFCGASLFLGSQGEDNTFLYGVARDLLRIRQSVGIVCRRRHRKRGRHCIESRQCELRGAVLAKTWRSGCL
jgi:hypothetical protein